MGGGRCIGKLRARVTNWLLTLSSLVDVLYTKITCFVWLCKMIDVIVWCCETHGYVWFGWVVIL